MLKSLLAIEGKSNVCLEIKVESNTMNLIMPFSKLIRERNVKENGTFVKRVFRNTGESRLKDKNIQKGLMGFRHIILDVKVHIKKDYYPYTLRSGHPKTRCNRCQ